jgi:hypothetical protein
MRPESANGAKPVASTTMRERKDGSSTRFQVYQRVFAFHQCQKSLRKITRKSSSLNIIGVTMVINSPEETLNDITTTNTIITTTSNNNT